ncbi:MAG: hypothetical protein KDB84_01290, partial [Flavobacteriales bacterium]|nr:hypothetical protein [Flavobacteriales bacterium]
MHRTLLLLAGTFLFLGRSNAQIAERIWAEPAVLKSFTKRILVVELPEPNTKVIDDFPKKTAAADEAAYRASLENYRAVIRPAIEEHWKYNSQIEFMTTSQIVELFTKKSTKHVVLLRAVLTDGGGVSVFSRYMGVPALVMTRTDGDHKVSKKGEVTIMKHDFQMYLTTSVAEDGTESYTAAGMKFTLLQAQKLLEWNWGNKKSESYIKYCKDRSKVNCSKMKNKELLVEENGLYKSVDKAEAKAAYGGPISFVTRQDLDAAYESGADDKAVLYSMPVGTILR